MGEFHSLVCVLTARETEVHMPHLYGGVVFIHEVVLDELDGESALAHASSPHDHKLIFGHSSPAIEKTKKINEQLKAYSAPALMY